ncbi:MAG: methyl-accepting chemotaxis protein [Planctomycetes bacterium]|nr:methyl-accepting chemotaxis protein [Planctomycetota bacterium]
MLSVKARVLSLAFMGLAFTAVVAGVAVFQLRKGEAAAEQIRITGEALRNHLEGDMMHDALRGDVLAARLATSDEERAGVREALNEHTDWFRKAVEANRGLEIPDAARRAIDEVGPSLANYVDVARRHVENGLSDPAKAASESGEFLAAFEDLETKMEQASDAIQAAANDARDSAATAALNAKLIVGGVTAAAVITLFSVAMIITRRLSRSLARCVQVMEAIASGDLTRRTEETGTDELGRMGAAADKAAVSMSELVGTIRAASGDVAGAATQIAASAEQLASGSKSQSSQVQRVASAVEEMSATVRDVAQRSGEAAHQAGESGKTAEEGRVVVTATIQDMGSINEAVTAGATSVTELGKQSESIGKVIEVIQDIAEQTNLLALNAAIEAARAGEHGRGFAVVADEVRKLADRTAKATGEVNTSIRSIQVETEQAVSKMHAGTERVRVGVERATGAGESLSRIVVGAQKVADAVSAIANAAQEQSRATDEISQSIASIASGAEEASRASAESAQAASGLSARAEQLNELVARFRVR